MRSDLGVSHWKMFHEEEDYWKTHSSEDILTDGSWKFITKSNFNHENYTMCEIKLNGGY